MNASGSWSLSLRKRGLELLRLLNLASADADVVCRVYVKSSVEKLVDDLQVLISTLGSVRRLIHGEKNFIVSG